MNVSRFGIGLALACGLALSASARGGDAASSYVFATAPVNAKGLKGLAELRGKPVLIEFWGTHCPPCIGEAVPSSLKLQQEYGDELQVLFVECQGADLATVEAFAWRQKWMGTQALWSTERPLEPEGDVLPKFALLDTEGNVLLKGSPLDQKKAIEDALAEQVKKAKDAPAGTPAKLAKPWATFVKGNIGAALVECDKLGAADASLTEAAKTLHAQMFARAHARIERAKWLIENGYMGEGRDTLVSLGKAVAGSDELTSAVADPLAKLLIDAHAGTEYGATQELNALQQKMTKGKPFDDGNLKALAKLAEVWRGTKAAEHATHLLQLAKLKLE